MATHHARASPAVTEVPTASTARQQFDLFPISSTAQRQLSDYAVGLYCQTDDSDQRPLRLV